MIGTFDGRKVGRVTPEMQSTRIELHAFAADHITGARIFLT